MSEQLVHLKFVIRPSPVLVDHRPLYKISQILLVLELSSRSGKSSLPRLQLFSWAMKRLERHNLLINAATQSILKVQAWGFDPALVIALKYACAENLITQVKTGYEISEAGIAFVKDIINSGDILVVEQEFLKRVGKKITEAMVDAVVESWKQK